MRLLDVEKEMIVKVVDFEAGWRLRARLAQYGLYPGDRVRLVRAAPFGGPVLIEVNGREIALGRGVAARIRVEVV